MHILHIKSWYVDIYHMSTNISKYVVSDATILVHMFFTTDDLGRYENAIQVFRQ